MIVLDNIIFAIQKSGGVSVVWSELLKRILKNKWSEILCLEYKQANNNITRIEFVIPTINIQKMNSSFLLLRRYFSPNIVNKKRFIFHSSYYRTSSNPRAINVTTVHDFTYEYYCTGIKKRIHLWQKHRAISKSNYIICISENTKKDLVKFMPNVDVEKIYVIYNGVSDDYFPIEGKMPIKLPPGFENPVLFVGFREKYKNFELAVKAVAFNKLKLVIVGASLTTNELDFLHRELGQANFIEMGRISNEELNCLYNVAMALLYPSEYEGFGIPILEAQRAGCPVIAFNGSSIPEVIGNTPLLLDTLSVESITECFKILSLEVNRQKIVNAGIENAKRFSWDRMYEQVISLYKEAWES